MVVPPSREPALEVLRAALRSAGLRATSPRLAVLRAMHAATAPVSHGDLAATLATEGLDRVTVYRNLMDLTEAGLLRRSDHGDHTWRFELQTQDVAVKEAHPHFMCNSCGDVVCLPEESVHVVAASGTPKAMQGRQYEVQIKGRCDRCA